MAVVLGKGLRREVSSGSCGLWDLIDGSFVVGDRDVADLVQDPGWAGLWTVRRRTALGDVACVVGDLGEAGFAGCRPVRRFSWRTGQRQRPGVQFMVSTGRHHGFESMAEQRLLLALDFAGDVDDVISQPFWLRFLTRAGWWEHVPDFLAWGPGGVVVVDVRPGGRIQADERVRFAATAEVALACGWRYAVVEGWRPHVMSVLDTLSSQRRDLRDVLGVQAQLMAVAGQGPMEFGRLVGATSYPAVARAHALHLLWHRRLAISVTAPLSDATVVSGADW